MNRLRALALAGLAVAAFVPTSAHAASNTLVTCPTGDATSAIQAAINTAASHPDAAVLGRSGKPQGVVTIGYPNTCRIFGVKVASNVRVVIDSGVTFSQYGNSKGSLFSLTGTNSSLLVGDTSRTGGHWTVNADAAQTGGNPDIHPINLTGSYLDVSGPYLIGNWSDASLATSKYKTTSGMIHYSGASYTWLSNAAAVHQPGGYGLTEVNSGSHLTFANLNSQGGYALRLETNPCKSSQNIDQVSAANITGSQGLGAVDLSAHSLAVTNVSITGVTANDEAYGVHITDASGYCSASSGGTVTGTVTSGCVTAGPSAQINSGNDTWKIGPSLTAVDKVGTASKLNVAVSKIGAHGTFAQGAGLIDPTVTC